MLENLLDQLLTPNYMQIYTCMYIQCYFYSQPDLGDYN